MARAGMFQIVVTKDVARHDVERLGYPGELQRQPQSSENRSLHLQCVVPDAFAVRFQGQSGVNSLHVSG